MERASVGRYLDSGSERAAQRKEHDLWAVGLLIMLDNYPRSIGLCVRLDSLAHSSITVDLVTSVSMKCLHKFGSKTEAIDLYPTTKSLFEEILSLRG
jgi:hypothetical protein